MRRVFAPYSSDGKDGNLQMGVQTKPQIQDHQLVIALQRGSIDRGSHLRRSPDLSTEPMQSLILGHARQPALSNYTNRKKTLYTKPLLLFTLLVICHKVSPKGEFFEFSLLPYATCHAGVWLPSRRRSAQPPSGSRKSATGRTFYRTWMTYEQI
jgi:hypothetical protein